MELTDPTVHNNDRRKDRHIPIPYSRPVKICENYMLAGPKGHEVAYPTGVLLATWKAVKLCLGGSVDKGVGVPLSDHSFLFDLGVTWQNLSQGPHRSSLM